MNITVNGIGDVPVEYDERGAGRTFLLLHGGAGPQSVTGFADGLAEAHPARVITPTHPGFGGTPRPDDLRTPADLAKLYVGLLDALDLTDVTVIGNSLGGWIAAEMALLGSATVGSIILVDAVGIEVPEHPPVDFFSLALPDIAQYSYHNPDAFRIDPSTMSPQMQAVMAGNRATLAVYGGSDMLDAGLAPRLSAVTVPTLVLWGESDRIVIPDYGRAFAAAIPGARFQLLPETGHVPQIETPAQLATAIWEFAAAPATS